MEISPGYNSFRRLLAYRVGQRFGLSHSTFSTEPTNEAGAPERCITLFKTPASSYPRVLLIDLPADYAQEAAESAVGTPDLTSDASPPTSCEAIPGPAESTGPRRMQLMKRQPAKSGADPKGAAPNRSQATAQSSEDKERAYLQARARIFGNPAAVGSDDAAADSADPDPVVCATAAPLESLPLSKSSRTDLSGMREFLEDSGDLRATLDAFRRSEDSRAGLSGPSMSSSVGKGPHPDGTHELSATVVAAAALNIDISSSEVRQTTREVETTTHTNDKSGAAINSNGTASNDNSVAADNSKDKSDTANSSKDKSGTANSSKDKSGAANNSKDKADIAINSNGTASNSKDKSGAANSSKDKSSAANNSKVKSGAANSSKDKSGAAGNSKDKSDIAINSNGAANNSKDKSGAAGNSKDKSGAANNSKDKSGAASNSKDKSGTSNNSKDKLVTTNNSKDKSDVAINSNSAANNSKDKSGAASKDKSGAAVNTNGAASNSNDKSGAANNSNDKSGAANNSKDKSGAANSSKDKSDVAINSNGKANNSNDKSGAANNSKDKSGTANSSKDKSGAANNSKDKSDVAINSNGKANNSKDKSGAASKDKSDVAVNSNGTANNSNDNSVAASNSSGAANNSKDKSDIAINSNGKANNSKDKSGAAINTKDKSDTAAQDKNDDMSSAANVTVGGGRMDVSSPGAGVDDLDVSRERRGDRPVVVAESRLESRGSNVEATAAAAIYPRKGELGSSSGKNDPPAPPRSSRDRVDTASWRENKSHYRNVDAERADPEFSRTAPAATHSAPPIAPPTHKQTTSSVGGGNNNNNSLAGMMRAGPPPVGATVHFIPTPTQQGFAEGGCNMMMPMNAALSHETFYPQHLAYPTQHFPTADGQHYFHAMGPSSAASMSMVLPSQYYSLSEGGGVYPQPNSSLVAVGVPNQMYGGGMLVSPPPVAMHPFFPSGPMMHYPTPAAATAVHLQTNRSPPAAANPYLSAADLQQYSLQQQQHLPQQQQHIPQQFQPVYSSAASQLSFSAVAANQQRRSTFLNGQQQHHHHHHIGGKATDKFNQNQN